MKVKNSFGLNKNLEYYVNNSLKINLKMDTGFTRKLKKPTEISHYPKTRSIPWGYQLLEQNKKTRHDRFFI
jgi:hypothetical protein